MKPQDKLNLQINNSAQINAEFKQRQYIYKQPSKTSPRFYGRSGKVRSLTKDEIWLYELKQANLKPTVYGGMI